MRFLMTGCPRSGTSILARILNSHPAVDVSFWEGQFVYALIHMVQRTRVPDFAPEVATLILDQTLRYHGRTVADAQGGRPLEYPKMKSILNAWRDAATPEDGMRNALAAFGDRDADKVPNYTHISRELRELFPDTPMVWSARDLTGTTESIFRFTKEMYHAFCPHDREAAALVWLRRQQQREQHPWDEQLDTLVQYEDLCASPAATVNDLLAHLGLPPAPEVDAFLNAHFHPRETPREKKRLRKFTERVSWDGITHKDRAELLGVESDYVDNPIQVLLDAWDRDRTSFRVHERLAWRYWEIGDLDQASHYAEKAYELGVKKKRYQRPAGKVALVRAWCAKLGGFRKAADYWCARSLELFPEYTLAQRYRSDVLGSG
jgi:hypothetical protein